MLRTGRFLRKAIGITLGCIGLIALAAGSDTAALVFREGMGDSFGSWPSFQRMLQMAGIGIAGPAVGIPLLVAAVYIIRDERFVVLFLRRFGHREATVAASDAIMSGLGSAWRLITLDDDTVNPVGLIGGPKYVKNGLVRAWLKLAYRFTIPITCISTLALVSDWVFDTRLWDQVGAHHAAVISDLFELKAPWNAIDASYGGVYAFFLLLLVLVLVVPCAALVAVFAFGGTGIWHSSTSMAKRAEGSQRRYIKDAPTMREVVNDLRRAPTRTFAPGMTVVTVVATFWRETVELLVRQSDVFLIDLSEAGSSLTWEIDLLTRSRLLDSCVLICEERRFPAVATAYSASKSPLIGRRVLTYKRHAKRRFARGLEICFSDARSMRVADRLIVPPADPLA